MKAKEIEKLARELPRAERMALGERLLIDELPLPVRGGLRSRWPVGVTEEAPAGEEHAVEEENTVEIDRGDDSF